MNVLLAAAAELPGQQKLFAQSQHQEIPVHVEETSMNAGEGSDASERESSSEMSIEDVGSDCKADEFQEDARWFE